MITWVLWFVGICTGVAALAFFLEALAWHSSCDCDACLTKRDKSRKQKEHNP